LTWKRPGPVHLDLEAARPRVERAGCDEPVVLAHRLGELGVGDAVGFEPRGIDDHLEKLLARAGELGFEDRGMGLELVLQLARKAEQRALGRVAE
jgi:hypothetical protein